MRTKPDRVLGFLSQMGSRVVVMAVSVISTAVLARLLSPVEFGIMPVALAVIALADAIFDGAFAINLVQRTKIDPAYVSTAFNLALLFATFLSLLLFASADLWEEVVDFTGLAIVLRCLSVTLVLKAAGMVSRNLLLRSHRLHALSVSTISGSVVGNLFVSCGLAFAGAGIWALVWGTLTAVVVETCLNIIQARPPLQLTISKTAAREVVGTGALYTLSQVLNWATNSGSSMIAANVLGPNDYGLYSRGNKLLELTTTAVGQPLMRVFYPSFARMKDDRQAAQAMLERAIVLASIPLAIASALLFAHAELIVQILLGSQWSETAVVAQILFFSLLPRCCYKITESAAFGLGAVANTVKRQAAFATVTLTAVVAGSTWGMTGFATSVAVANWVNYLISLKIAADLTETGLRRLVSGQLTPIVIGLLFGIIDILVGRSAAAAGEWVGHLLGAAAACSLSVILLLILPPRFLSSDIIIARRKLLAGRLPSS